MQAFRLTRWGNRGELVECPKPEPRAGEVLLQITASGACHSDLHLMDWPEGLLPWKLPFTLGHENAGRVAAVGEGVTDVKVGDNVLVYGPWGCGACHPCRLGRENYCERAASIPAAGGGLGRDGGMADFMLVPSSRLLVPIGDLDPVQAAPLADAALTPYHAIRNASDRLVPGAWAVVIGIGGLGHMAIQLLRATTGARIIAVDTNPARLESARMLGADAAVPSDAGAADTIKKLADGVGAHVVLDMVGSEGTLQLAAKSLRAEGKIVIVGLAGGALPVSFFGVPYGAQVATSYWGTVAELMELVSLARAGRISVVTEVFSLDRAPEAYERLRKGEVRGRAVIVPRR
jgi:propanol-preferring alcohol dehydrogenase